MSKGYWITLYRSVTDEAALKKYAGLAAPIIEAQGGRILARGMPTAIYESGIHQRVVVIEFENVKSAITAYESAEYQAVQAILKDAVERDLRIVEGV
jgi:uncharacterized protein (DUF1330 family)